MATTKINDSASAMPAALVDPLTGNIAGNETKQGTSSSPNLTAATAVKASAGRLVRISVIVAGSAAGAANDCATTGAAAAGNQIAAIPNAVGVITLDWPCATGIVVVPGTGQTLAVSYS